MNIKWSKHITSAVNPEGYPESELPEVAMVGRSNVGKSSVINFLTGRKSLARVGNTPGKTRLINFFSLEDKMLLVDLPGYGYAQVSKEERARWGKIVETYLHKRDQLKLVLMLADIRHKPTADDRLMVEWLNSMGKPYIIIATKADKITRTHYKEHLLEIRKTLDLLPDVPVIPVSVTKNTGFDQLWNQVLKVLPELFPRDDGVNSPV
ncbi:MAG: YihA family ribosome biogenesis GTP-binding protein [Ruminiclostridium sp.]|nr:YihA family ribosome biogenesis GTP-binding protein [Ruminiclostridium sp.]